MSQETDVAVLGAGSAGAAASLLCARRGLSVVCIERRDLNRAGTPWVNELPAACFDETEIPRPTGDELVSQGDAFHLVAGWGPAQIVVRDHESLTVDTRRLVVRLQSLAKDAGVTMLGRAFVRAIDGEVVRTSAGDVRARIIVDASGFSGARLPEKVPIRTSDVCAAAHEVHVVRNMDAASAFFAIHGSMMGETICFTGIAGGYSVLNVRLTRGLISILAASIPGDGQPSGRSLLQAFLAQNRWIGETVFGGSRAIPLSVLGGPLGHGNVARIGDAGHQVFSAHGSGMATGLLAARVLADALAAGEGVEGYDVAWHRRYGALHATSDLFRRFTQTLAPEDIAKMIRCGLVSEEMVRAGLEQRWPLGGARTLVSVARAARWPWLAFSVWRLALRAVFLRLSYRFYAAA